MDTREQHTPGPWRWEIAGEPGGGSLGTGLDSDDRVLRGSTGVVLCGNGGAGASCGDVEVSAADARLIAAAPELLEAARQAQCACTIRERDSGHLVDCWMPDLRAAIAKATGTDR